MYQYPPPMWGYPQMPPNMNDDHFKRGLIFAAKLAQREEREKERKKNNEKKDRENARKAAAASRARFWLGMELFLLGIIAQPFVVPAYNALLKAATTVNP